MAQSRTNATTSRHVMMGSALWLVHWHGKPADSLQQRGQENVVTARPS